METEGVWDCPKRKCEIRTERNGILVNNSKGAKHEGCGGLSRDKEWEQSDTKIKREMNWLGDGC